jgi:prepilin-type N-terminal cleavage/methylation domain-containing protein
MRRSQDQGGFTMIEMLMVLLVTGILMAIAVPSIQRHIARNDLRAAAREVASLLRSSRSAALNEQVPRYVLFTPPRTLREYRFDPVSGQWQAERNDQPLEPSVSFTSAGVTFPSLTDTPATGVSVPAAGTPAGAKAAYFDTRGRWPSGQSGPFTIQLTGGFGLTRSLTVYGQTGAVSGI